MKTIRKSMPVKKKTRLSVDWETDRSIAKELADFFIVNVTPAYISYGEIQCGRAIDSRRWSPKFREVLLDELKGAIKTSGNVREGRRIAVAKHDGIVLGIVVIGIHLEANHPHVVIEDFVVDQNKRGNGYGKEILKWVELQAAKMKAVDVFIESGISNEGAHDFFRKNGFEVVSKVMIKKVHYEK
jgi:N-acetylglutamate synthase-like GNAT family acetyltransferase